MSFSGMIILGKPVDDTTDGFKGAISQVNVWSVPYSLTEMSELYTSRTQAVMSNGHIYQWKGYLLGYGVKVLHGGLNTTCGTGVGKYITIVL